MATQKPSFTSTYTTDYSGPFARTIGAIRSADGNDWALADAILSEVQRGPNGDVPATEWDRLQAALTATGTGGKSVNTLRLYWGAADFWPVSDRISGVSFTAHRRAKSIGDLGKAKSVIARVLKAKGGNPAAVAERDIVAAVQAAKGVTPAAVSKASGQGASSTTAVDPFTALLQAANALTLEILQGGTSARLASAHKVLTATLGRIEKVQKRQAANVTTVGKGKGKAAAPKVTAPKTAAAGMRG